MGVPKFFRWVTDRYPSILSGVVDDTFDKPQIDNLYLDMNGIIHNCSHDNEELTISITYDQIIAKVLLELDRLVSNMVLPLELVFIAVDGVAPRAKLNQQRSRRFRSARDRLATIARERMKGLSVADQDIFDSNCITPGTAFMTELSIGIQEFINEKMRDQNSLWSRISVYFSGSEVPGEGEHKIMAFIRDQRALPGYKPNQRHCINGSDADMIMLALATHEPYFMVLRDVLEIRRNPGTRYAQLKTTQVERTESPAVVGVENTTANITAVEASVAVVEVAKKPKNMQYVRIHVLREYLANELLEAQDTGAHDMERVIDDFVFLTFFVGNDFLPHLPALDIGDSAFDVIFDAYKTVLMSAEDDGGLGDEEEGDKSGSSYLVDGDVIDLEKLELIFALIGVTELTMYTENETAREWKEARITTMRAQERQNALARQQAQELLLTLAETVSVASADSAGLSSVDNDVSSTAVAHSAAHTSCSSLSSVTTTQSDLIGSMEASSLLTAASPLDRELEYKHKYYLAKFGIDVTSDSSAGQNPAVRAIVTQYLLGLQWCLSYYTRGCVSWSYFYPYHYGPFLHDMRGLSGLFGAAGLSSSCLELSAPFTPFQQLLACLPANSCNLLPAPYCSLMTDSSSPLIEYYPSSFSTDLNGKKQEYESVVLLPFIDKDALLRAESLSVDLVALSAEEKRRNTFGVTHFYAVETNEDMEELVTSSEMPVNIHPGQCFSSRLIEGTVTTGDVKGFLSLARMEVGDVFVNKRGGTNNSSKYYSKANKGKSNFYSNSNVGIAMVPGSGDVSLLSGQSSETLTEQSAGVVPSFVALPIDFTIRMLLDDGANKFLCELAEKIEMLSSGAFQSLLTAQKPAPFSVTVFTSMRNGVVSNNSSIAKNTDVSRTSQLINEGDSGVASDTSGEPAATMLCALTAVLDRTAAIFSPVQCALQPNCKLTLLATSDTAATDNSNEVYMVAVKFKNHWSAPHYDQVEEFLKSNITEKVFGMGVRVQYWNRIYSVTIGHYAGGNAKQFQLWLNNELLRLRDIMPVFTGQLIELQYSIVGDTTGSGESNVVPDTVRQYQLSGQ